MLYYEEVFTAFRTIIVAAWPDVGGENGIYHFNEFVSLPFVEKAETKRLPVAVVEYEFEENERRGIANWDEDGLVRISRIDLRKKRLLDMVEHLERLRAILVHPDTAADLRPAQRLGYPQPDWSPTSNLNDYFIRNMKPFWAASLLVRFRAGRTTQ